MAIEAARREKSDVCFVELSTSGGDVPQAVLVALGLREPGLLTGGALPDPGKRLVDGLAGRSLLLVLDNCEHVIAEAAQLVRRLLAGCPGLRVLATSREALSLTGETLFPLGALPPDAAARLFADRAAAVAPETVHEPAAVARVCEALDGLPLAIELAAARLRALTLDDLASRLGDRFRLLSRGDRTAEPRHRTLRGVVAWSWALLEPEEQWLARRFAVFSGGARLAAVERICGDDAEELLAGLVEKSLIEVADGRYRMLETIRAYCGEQLVEAGEEAELRAAHAEYFADFARAAEPKLRGGEQLDWLARLTAEHADLLAALRWSAVERPRLALRLLAALSWYWWLRGLRGEATPFADDVLAAIGPQPPEGLEEEYVLCLIHASTTDVLIEPILLVLGRPLRYPFLFLLWMLSERPKATDAGALAELVGPDPWARAFSRIGDGLGALYAGQAELAEQHFTESLNGFRALGDRWGEASALEKLAEFADRRGDLARFSALMDEAVRLVGELGSAEDTADLLCRRADGVLRGGDVASARADYERAAVRARAAGAPVMLARAHGGLGEVARRSGDLAEARRWFELALDGCGSASLSGGEIRAKLLTGLGWTAASEGDRDAAAALQQDALAVALDHTNLPSAAAAVEGLAGILADRDEGERAAFLLGVAVALRGSTVSGDADVAAIEATARARIGADAYVNAFDRGARMAPDQAIEELGGRRSAIGS
jgi:predicted ATPase